VVEEFPPEYAHIVGIPFEMFKGGKTTQPLCVRKSVCFIL